VSDRKLDAMLLGSIELFCLAAERGSFTAAAHGAGVTPAAVSRSVARLEERLGARLFVRTTRTLRLTDAGRAYAESCRDALERLREAEREVGLRQHAPTGLVRVSAPTTYAHHRLLPRLPAFRARYPGVRVDVHVGNRNVDLGKERFDLAIRVRAQPDSSVVVRKLEDAELVVVASPEYLSRAGIPRALDALAEHECLQFELPSTGRTIPWAFVVEGREVALETRGSVAVSEDVLAGVTLALAGAGLYPTYRFVVERELAAGALVEVLQPFRGASRPFSLLYPHATRLPQRTRALVDFLLEGRPTPSAATRARRD
jgi:DNA-binding transcriptional LysR family regulator